MLHNNFNSVDIVKLKVKSSLNFCVLIVKVLSHIHKRAMFSFTALGSFVVGPYLAATENNLQHQIFRICDYSFPTYDVLMVVRICVGRYIE